MRTHYLHTRSRIRSIVIDVDKKPYEGLWFHVPYVVNGDQYDDIYDVTGVLVDEDQTPIKVRYERRN